MHRRIRHNFFELFDNRQTSSWKNNTHQKMTKSDRVKLVHIVSWFNDSALLRLRVVLGGMQTWLKSSKSFAKKHSSVSDYSPLKGSQEFFWLGATLFEV